MEIQDETIKLRPFELEDAEEHLAGEDEEQIKWLSGGKGTIEGVRDWIKKNKEQWENNGHILNFAITDKQSGKLLGMIEANGHSQELEGLEEGDVNISYGLYPFARGKGYATNAVNLILKFLKEKGFKRAIIKVNPNNKDSLKIPLRCGFVEGKTIITKDKEKLIIFRKDLQD
ncbi:MAG TPA: GNAT family N-acetyltransferase [Patescibacteria group bacterium]|nr:GNAT family N-acetyltransferase [Patescibacteria group bacterium]